MSSKLPTVIDKLAAYQAAKLSTQPLYDECLGSGGWKTLEIKASNYMSALERPGRLIVARKCL